MDFTHFNGHGLTKLSISSSSVLSDVIPHASFITSFMMSLIMSFILCLFLDGRTWISTNLNNLNYFLTYCMGVRLLGCETAFKLERQQFLK